KILVKMSLPLNCLIATKILLPFYVAQSMLSDVQILANGFMTYFSLSLSPHVILRYRFDDERVTKEEAKKALEEQYGGEEEVSLVKFCYSRTNICSSLFFHSLITIACVVLNSYPK